MLDFIETQGIPLALDTPDFRGGYVDGIGTYESTVKYEGRSLTTIEACQELQEHASIEGRARECQVDYDADLTPMSIHYRAGFFAGWFAAHLADVYRHPSYVATPLLQEMGVSHA